MKFTSRTIRLDAVSKFRWLLFVTGVFLAGCAKLPDDGKDARVMRFDHLSNYRYCEVFLIGGNGLTKNLVAGVYNTTDLNMTATQLDGCTDESWAKVDADAIKKQYEVLGVYRNGPRYWLYDWVELPVGMQRDFGGLQMRWFTEVQLPKDLDVHKKGGTAYKPTTVARKSKAGYTKGQTVFILDAPDGTPWVMQAYSRIVDKGLNYEDLKTLDKKLALPPGWMYRVKVLEQDLTLHAVNGVARIVQDELQSTYNACFTEGKDSACSFQP